MRVSTKNGIDSLIETNGELIDRGSIRMDKNRDPADRRRVEIRLFRFEDR